MVRRDTPTIIRRRKRFELFLRIVKDSFANNCSQAQSMQFFFWFFIFNAAHFWHTFEAPLWASFVPNSFVPYRVHSPVSRRLLWRSIRRYVFDEKNLKNFRSCGSSLTGNFKSKNTEITEREFVSNPITSFCLKIISYCVCTQFHELPRRAAISFDRFHNYRPIAWMKNTLHVVSWLLMGRTNERIPTVSHTRYSAYPPYVRVRYLASETETFTTDRLLSATTN